MGDVLDVGEEELLERREKREEERGCVYVGGAVSRWWYACSDLTLEMFDHEGAEDARPQLRR